MRLWKATFNHGNCECEEEEIFEAETEDDAEVYADDMLTEYIETHANCAQGYDYHNGWESEADWASYEDGCYFSLEEITNDDEDLI